MQSNNMQLADNQFNQGNYSQAIQLYNQFINTNSQIHNKNPTNHQSTSIALLNLSSAYFSSAKYENCLLNARKYLENVSQSTQNQPKVQAYILCCRSFIKLKKLLSHQEHQLLAQAEKAFPYHKVLQQAIKTVKEIQISQDEDEYMERIFEKLLCHTEMRKHVTDESFLTKVQKIIRNPSLAGALVKIDKRLENITEIILMAEEEENPNLKTK